MEPFQHTSGLCAGKIPFAVQYIYLWEETPFLYGSTLLAIVLAASLLIILLTATLFTFGQVFLGDTYTSG